MKYYTREWYHLLQKWGLGDHYHKIPDGSYSDERIQTIYDKKLKKEIARDKKDYNTRPVFFFTDLDDLDLDDFFIVDETTGKARKPDSIEEVKADYEKEYEAAIEEFNNREPFDPQETIDLFRDIYLSNLETLDDHLPNYVLNGVDHRLLALDYMTETIYLRYKQEMKAKKKEWLNIDRKAQRVLKKQNVPDLIHEALALHDAYLLSLRKVNKNLVMIIRKDEYPLDGETPYRKIIFKDVEILEKDDLRVIKYDDQGYYNSNVEYLYHEIYCKDHNYEVHMMFFKNNQLPYLTFKCKDITYEDDIKL